MNKSSSSCYVRRPWVYGKNKTSLYLGIPSAIVQKVGITKNTYLLFELLDDTIIIKKDKAEFTKREKQRIRDYFNHKEETDDKEENNMIDRPFPKDYKNPLDELDDI